MGPLKDKTSSLNGLKELKWVFCVFYCPDVTKLSLMLVRALLWAPALPLQNLCLVSSSFPPPQTFLFN